ncbi:hypothetical protein Cgig2_027584 [Carnegiea gigantea]|uniref:Uncharacterized protein n=1 Tax=Carnegiea gigantea TaxID=171969 RepID=A0A9Q1JHC8_9CARY|nr:hypothetical protein Cgig2_027584 [Carnegiea gigantea]
MDISSSVTLGGSKAPRRYQLLGLNYVLNKRELGDRVRLNEWWGALAWRGYGPLITGSSIDEGLIARLLLPPLVRGRRPRPPLAGARSAAAPEPVGLWQASSHEERGRVPVGKRLSLYNPRAMITRRCLSSSNRCSESAATYSGVASPVLKTVSLALA